MIEVTLLDKMGSDLTVVNSARVSFAKTHFKFDDQKDERLIKYLAKHKHTSPFGHCFASFHVKAPVFVARQLVKHKFLRWNEVSRRYVSSEPEFYSPKWRWAATNKKQGSAGEMSDEHSDSIEMLNQRHTEFSAWTYDRLLDAGVSEEQARTVLPQSMMTEWYWSGSLDAFADMCNLRCYPDAQKETREVADIIDGYMGEHFPVSWKALRGENNGASTTEDATEA